MASRGNPHSSEEICEVSRHFAVGGEFISAAPFGTGHINDSYAALFTTEEGRQRFFIQRINQHVFKDPAAVMANIERVTAHLREKLKAAGVGELERRALTIVSTLDGRTFWHDGGEEYWRVYELIEGAHSFEIVRSPGHAEACACAFGHFQQLLNDLPGPRLIETIPNFHNTPSRYRALETAIQADAVGRVAAVQAEIDFAMSRKDLSSRLVEAQARGDIPERIVHNDTKVSNVLMDEKTGAGICVVDLDTVMPGLALYDFGDMVRTATNPAAEDERDLEQVTMQMPLYEALVKGYLSSAGGFLTPAEVEELAFSGLLITLQQGVRFLTDHLEGDRYFRVLRDNHNLDRCRTQFKLVQSMEEKAEEMAVAVAPGRG